VEKANQARSKVNGTVYMKNLSILPLQKSGSRFMFFYKPPNNGPKAPAIWNAAGAIRMIIMEGKVNKAIGMIIFTGALCANSSAY
jgi:hypothetical protein